LKGSPDIRFWRLLDLPWRLYASLSIGMQRRLIGLWMLVPSATVLYLAAHLSPDPSGVGTPTQLGLGTCTLLLLTDWPCPMCGMTTTFSHLAHGELLAGFLNQPFGLVLFALTLGAALLGLWEVLLARGQAAQVFYWALGRDFVIVSVALAGLIGGWIYKVLLLRDWLPWS